MDNIGKEYPDVPKIFDQTFVDLTQKMLSVEMRRSADSVKDQEAIQKFVVRTEGAFTALIEFQIEEALYEMIAKSIFKGRILIDHEKKLYVIEYLNIICGRFLSDINNKLKRRSRLSVPMRVATNEINERSGTKEKLSYQCPYGMVTIVIYYDKAAV